MNSLLFRELNNLTFILYQLSEHRKAGKAFQFVYGVSISTETTSNTKKKLPIIPVTELSIIEKGNKKGYLHCYSQKINCASVIKQEKEIYN